MRKGFRVFAHVCGKRFLRIAGTLAHADDAGGIVAFKDRTVFGKGKFLGGVLGGLPIGIVRAAFAQRRLIALQHTRMALALSTLSFSACPLSARGVLIS